MGSPMVSNSNFFLSQAPRRKRSFNDNETRIRKKRCLSDHLRELYLHNGSTKPPEQDFMMQDEEQNNDEHTIKPSKVIEVEEDSDQQERQDLVPYHQKKVLTELMQRYSSCVNWTCLPDLNNKEDLSKALVLYKKNNYLPRNDIPPANSYKALEEEVDEHPRVEILEESYDMEQQEDDRMDIDAMDID